TLESTGDDDIYNNAEVGEDGTVTATISLPDDFDAANDTLTINGEEYSLSADEIAAGSVTVEVAPEGTVTAQITDAAGNTSTQASETAAAADTEVKAPTITLESTGDDDIYNNAEVGEDGTVTATISLPDDFDAANDTLTINGEEYSLSADEIAAGSVTVEVAPEGTVTAQITDAAGNTSTQASETAAAADTEVKAPTITLESTGDDDIYNNAEVGEDGTVTATISLPDDFDAANDTLTINGEEYSLSADEIAAGSVTVEVAPEGTVTAQITDAAGNTSTQASETAAAADTEVKAPTITLESTGDDDIYNNAEVGEDGTVTATISLPDDFDAANDTLTINGEEYSLSADEIAAGSVTVEVAPEGTVTAQITDAAGNTSTQASETAAAADTEVKAPTITLESTGDDDIYNNAEVGEDGTVTATISLPDDFDAANDTLTINGEEYSLSADEIAAGSVTVEVAPEGTVTAQITDAAGNTSTQASETAAAADTEVKAPTITLESTGDDDIYNNAEVGEDGTVTATISLPDDFDAANDTLTINGEEYSLSADEIAAGSVTVEVAPEGTVTAQITDAAGNTSTQASETAAAADTEVKAPTITLESTGDDDIYNNAEVGEDGTVTATISLPDDFDAANDTLTINGEEYSLSADEIAAGSVTVEVAPEGTVTAQITDAAGNTSTQASETAAAADTEVKAPTITLESTGDDDIYNNAEVGEDGTVTATISLPDDFDAANDTLTINGEEYSLSADEIAAGSVTVEVAPEGTVTAQITDAAGNTSTQASETAAAADTEVKAPTITLESTGDDDIYNNAEVGEDGTVTATISLPDDFDAANDTLTINGEEYSLSADEIAAGSVTVEVAPEGTVTAQITDAAGNTSTQASETAAAADTEVKAPTITLESTGDDDIYNNAEVGEDGTVTATISLPDDFDAANDTLTINGEEYSLSADEIAAGSVTVEVAPEGTVTAQITDAAGNTSTQASETAAAADTEVKAPTITLESTGDDDIYNNAEVGEDGTVTATISLPDDFDAANDTLTINGEEYSLSADEIAAGSVTVEVAPEGTVTAQITDAAGNTSTQASETAAVEVAPEGTVTAQITDAAGNTSTQASETAAAADTEVKAPTITLESTGDDDIYNNAEVGEDGTVTATISLPDDFDAANDTLTINGEEYSLSADEIAAGSVTVEVAPEGTVTAQITDAAGNTSTQASETAAAADTEVKAPTITLESTGDDDIYNNAEVGEDGTVTATISLPDDFDAANDTLTINGEEYSLSADEIAAGSVTVEVAPEGTVTAQITDAAGNTSTQASETAAAADTEVKAPTITLESTGDDDIYNNAEVGEDGTVTATISLPDDFDAANDTLTINGEEYSLSADEIAAGSVTVEVAPEGTVTAQITDAAGNTSTQASETAAAADTEVKAPTITLESTGDDDIYNNAEVGEDGTVTATISLPDDFDAANDTLTINGEEYSLSADEIAAGSVTVEVAPEGTVTAQITDAAGNTSTQASETAAAADTEVKAPTITLESTGDDDIYNNAEVGEDGTVTATISLPDDFDAANDTLTINGEEYSLSADEIAAGSVTVEVAPEGTVTAQITDAAGNTSTQASETAAAADTEVKAPTITLESTGDDDIYNNAEVGEDGTVTATISLPDDFDAANDTLTINGEEYSLSADEIAAGSVTVEVAPEGTVTAQITDAAGNTSTQASETAAAADTEVKAPTITLESTGDDDIYNNAEVGEDGTVTATISLPDDFDAANDTLTINGEEYSLSADEIAAGSVTVEVAPEGTVTAQITDAAGNTSTQASETAAAADTEVKAPTITLESTGDDDIYNNAEVGEDGTVTATISLPDDFDAANDTLTINGEEYSLSADEIAAGSVTVEVAPEGTVTAQITDAAGNTSTQASETAAAADTEVKAPTITLESTGDDDIYNNAEVGEDGTVTATISLPDDFDAANDTLTINGEEYSLSADEIAAGSVTVEVAPEGTVTAQITDAAGNTSTQASETAAAADTEVKAPTITLESTGDDDIYNNAEVGEDGTVTATISLPDDFDAANDTLTINGEEYSLSADEIAAGSVTVEVAPEGTVTAQITDAAGNTSTQASETAAAADTEVKAPTITLESTGDDDIYNNAEVGEDGTVTATISLPDDFDAANDTLTINGEEYSLSADEIAAGSVTVEVAPEGTVTAQITDAAGNTSTQASETAAAADTEVKAPT
ncbi:hypothetical protein, partial [Vibrio salinus]|uniref:hypothetical protein n=1 Tax=Vibrio salinus TaxID=2899784 RepID=UPI001E4054D9